MNEALWVGPEGQWPLPWLESAWRHAAAQRGHALMLHGPSGVGQFELALTLAQGWLCEGGGMQPCGRCGACHLLHAGVHPDFLLLVPDALRESLGISGAPEEEGSGGDAASHAQPARGKAAGREIRVADIRRAIDWAHQSSSRSRAKVMVLHPAQQLNPVAANALLKTLEEPPGQLRIILSCADPQALLPTLRSRCQKVSLAIPPAALARDWLRQQGVDEPDVLLGAAGGSPQEALSLARDGITARLWPEVPAMLRAGRLEAFSGLPLPRTLEVMQKVCLDLMARALGAQPRYFPAEALPAGARLESLSAWSRRLTQVARHDEHPWNAGLILESLVLQARGCWPDRSASNRSERVNPNERHRA